MGQAARPAGSGPRATFANRRDRRGHPRVAAILIAAAALFLLAAGPPADAQVQTQEEATEPEPMPPMRCDCVLDINFAKPERYLYWQRERIWAEMIVELEAADGSYQVARMSEVTICEQVRAPRRDDQFRTLDTCLHLGEWLERIAEEVRCTTGADGQAQCRIPALSPGGGDFLRGTGTGTEPAAAICDALDATIDLRLREEMHRLDREELHGLPDLQHSHFCRPL